MSGKGHKILHIRECYTSCSPGDVHWTYALDGGRDLFKRFSGGCVSIPRWKLPAFVEAASLDGWRVAPLDWNGNPHEPSPPEHARSTEKGALGAALEEASALMGSRRRTDAIDPATGLPMRIVKAAAEVSEYMGRNHGKRWELGDICDRNFAYDAKEALCAKEWKTRPVIRYSSTTGEGPYYECGGDPPTPNFAVTLNRYVDPGVIVTPPQRVIGKWQDTDGMSYQDNA